MEIQCKLFEEATAEEIRTVKGKLLDYKKIPQKLLAFEKIPPETGAQQMHVDKLKHDMSNIERAVRSIYDEEIRQIMQHRFIEGNPRKSTVTRFTRTLIVVDKTVDRKMAEGIKIVAENLKLWGEI